MITAEEISIVSTLPAGVKRYPIVSRQQWLALRKSDVTASVAGCLLGVHEYQTCYGLYCLKAGLIAEDFEETPPMRRGRLLEPVAVQMLAEDRPNWTIERGAHYFSDAASRIGATPDAFAIDPERSGFGAIQFKTVEPGIYRRKWKGDDEFGTAEPPLWIAIQAIVEATLTGASWAAVCPLVVGFGLEMPIIEIELHAGIMTRLRAEVAEFWHRVETGEAPSPDYARDGAIIAELHSADDGTTIDLRGNNRVVDLLATREALKAREDVGNMAAKDRKAIDAEIINILGPATRGTLSDGRTIEAKTTRRGAYQVKETSYRTVKVKAS